MVEIDEDESRSDDSESICKIWPISAAYAFGISITASLDSIGPALQTSIGASRAVSSYTYVGFNLGAAVSASISGMMFKRFGRKKVFLIGALFELIGTVAILLAVLHKSVSSVLI